jgi:hypothetical protein
MTEPDILGFVTSINRRLYLPLTHSRPPRNGHGYGPRRASGTVNDDDDQVDDEDDDEEFFIAV